MRLNRTGSAWKPIISPARKEKRNHGIYGIQQFRDLIVYERVRSDRTGEDLSVVVFDTYQNGGLPKKTYVEALTGSIRSTDHLGWYDAGKLGVLLPLTDYTGAARFVETLKATENSAGKRVMDQVPVTIQSYPEKWLREENDESDDQPNGKDAGVYFTYRVPRWKRVLDIIGSLSGIVVLSPFLILVALYIKLVSPGPVIFRQKRVGIARREFTFFKFRTMHHSNNVQVHSHHAKDFINFDKPMTKLDGVDPRIIKGGRILRKLAVDELPQLFNILRGDMSLVGPRPCIPYEADEYLRWHHDRFSILPGLTGLWQVSGKNKLTFQQMIRLDIEYGRRMSLWYDLWIILRTFPTVAQLAIEGTTRRINLGKEKLKEKVAEHDESGVGFHEI